MIRFGEDVFKNLDAAMRRNCRQISEILRAIHHSDFVAVHPTGLECGRGAADLVEDCERFARTPESRNLRPERQDLGAAQFAEASAEILRSACLRDPKAPQILVQIGASSCNLPEAGESDPSGLCAPRAT